MIRVVVNKRRWLRGDDENSKLLRVKDNKMCCIGFLARELGCKRKDIAEVGMLCGVKTEAAQAFNRDYGLSGTGYMTPLDKAYEVNDDTDLNDKERMRQLREIGKEMGVRFVFK